MIEKIDCKTHSSFRYGKIWTKMFHNWWKMINVVLIKLYHFNSDLKNKTNQWALKSHNKQLIAQTSGNLFLWIYVVQLQLAQLDSYGIIQFVLLIKTKSHSRCCFFFYLLLVICCQSPNSKTLPSAWAGITKHPRLNRWFKQWKSIFSQVVRLEIEQRCQTWSGSGELLLVLQMATFSLCFHMSEKKPSFPFLFL